MKEEKPELISPEERERILAERKIWYSHDFVIYEIVKSLNLKECALILDKKYRETEKPKRFRYYRAWAKDYLLLAFKTTDFFDYPVNIYHSTAYYKTIPKFTFDKTKRSIQTQEFNKSRNEQVDKMRETGICEDLEYINGTDFLCDIDKTDENFYNDAKKFKEICDLYALPYYLICSSGSGMHFCIEWKYLHNAFPDKKVVELMKDNCKIIENIRDIYELENLDLHLINEVDKLKKCPFSYVCKDGTIAISLSDEQFQKFTPELVRMPYILENFTIFRRGLLTRNLNLSEKQLSKNIQRFWRDFLE